LIASPPAESPFAQSPTAESSFAQGDDFTDEITEEKEDRLEGLGLAYRSLKTKETSDMPLKKLKIDAIRTP
jgi:hypothetical protein